MWHKAQFDSFNAILMAQQYLKKKIVHISTKHAYKKTLLTYLAEMLVRNVN